MAFDFEQQDDAIDFPELVSIARAMFEVVLDDFPAHRVQVAVEQIRASIRENLLDIGCDPTDEIQLRAFALGAMFATHRQVQYTPIGHETAIVPATAINMIKDMSSKDEMVNLEKLSISLENQILEEERKKKAKEEKLKPTLRSFISYIRDFRNVRK